MSPCRLLPVLALFVSLTAAAGAQAETLRATVILTPENEVPPNQTDASGSGEVTFDTQTRQLSWQVMYSNLSGPALGAHFHGAAQPGNVAGIVVPLGTSITSPVSGSRTVTASQARDLVAGKWYMNVHTDRNPGGELRGQVVFR